MHAGVFGAINSDRRSPDPVRYNSKIFVELLQVQTANSEQRTRHSAQPKARPVTSFQRALRCSFMKLYCGALVLLLPGYLRVGAVAHV